MNQPRINGQTDSSGFTDFLNELQKQSLPPVANWKPSTARDMDLVIRADGKWYYQGTVFKRQRLVNLLAKVLICEDDQYYLVSPSEKLRITVEDAPFIATDFECSVTDDSQLIIFGTNVNQKVQLDDKHPLWMAIPPNGDTEIPYIRVRDQLVARLTRSVFYRLTDLGCEHSNNGKQVFGIESAGTFFELGAVSW